jgi:hypothetical protein
MVRVSRRRALVRVALALLLAAVAILASSTVAPLGGPVTEAGAQAVPYSVTVTPTTGITDGRQVSITIKTTVDHPIYEAQVRMCRGNVDYQPSTGAIPAPDFAPTGPNCPPAGVSTSATPVVIRSADTVYRFAPTPEGDVTTMRLGVGVAGWTDSDGVARTLTCDARNPCSLVAQINTAPVGVAPTWIPVVVPITFAEGDPLVACGGPAPGILSSGGSDALQDAWINWTLATCGSDGTSGAWSSNSFGDEVVSLERFDTGSLDLAYSGVGLSGEAGFVPNATRPTVAVPVGISAVSLGLENGYFDNDNRKRPYGPTNLTLDELTALVTGGAIGIAPYETAIKSRNRELDVSGLFTNTTMQMGGPSEGGTAAWLTSRHLSRLRPDLWRVPNHPAFGEGAGRSRGVDSSFALADPS